MKIKDLKLALSATPKKPDIRYYLNGVKVTENTVTASNGNILCHINTYQNELPDNIENDYLIVPVETIKALLKKVGAKHDNKEVGIFLINNRYELTCMNQTEIFTPIEHKYPGFNKIIDPIKANEHDKNLNSIQHQFDWDYVSLANKAICIYFGNTTPKRLYSFELAGYFMPCEDVIYVIMPCRI